MVSSSDIIISIAIVTVFFGSSVLGTEHVVGDDKGWTLNFDYQTWAASKEFRVGDTLVFKYPKGVHNVLKVDGVGFEKCVANDTAQPLVTGNDVIPLVTPGRKWYICNVGQHCATKKLKLFINVLAENEIVSPMESPSLAPIPPKSGAIGKRASMFYGTMVIVVGILVVVIV